MPKKIPQFLEYFLEDCLNGNPQFTVKSMFGGYGIYKNGKIFSLLADDIIYFKVGENNKKLFEEKGSNPFTYEKGDKKFIMSYWVLPEEILENREELDSWIEKSLKVEIKTKSNKKSKKDLELDNKILKKLLEIPNKKVTTYKILADIFKVHPRRVASVMKQNKNPDIFPCYKVISHSRELSGYSGPNGVNSKIEMLESDLIEIVDGKISEKFVWKF